MGSGERIKFNKTSSFGFGVYLSRFPFDWTLDFHFVCWSLSIGFGKGYDE